MAIIPDDARCMFHLTHSLVLFVGTVVLLGCHNESPHLTNTARLLNNEQQNGHQNEQQAEADASSAEAPLAEQIQNVLQGDDDRVLVTAEVTDSRLANVPQLDGLRELLLDGGSIQGEGLQPPSRWPNLRHLRLRYSPIDDQGLQLISQMKSLQIVNLPQARCTDAGIECLAALPDLRQLRLASPLATSDICKPISKLTSLRSLHLIDIPVDDNGLMLLADLPDLQSLYLDNAAVSDSGWTKLFDRKPGLHVHIDQRHHDLDPAKHP
ncbi:MAG: hypothetical protein R3C05_07545 [Pirellulaceae bacterium]